MTLQTFNISKFEMQPIAFYRRDLSMLFLIPGDKVFINSRAHHICKFQTALKIVTSYDPHSAIVEKFLK